MTLEAPWRILAIHSPPSGGDSALDSHSGSALQWFGRARLLRRAPAIHDRDSRRVTSLHPLGGFGNPHTYYTHYVVLVVHSSRTLIGLLGADHTPSTCRARSTVVRVNALWQRRAIAIPRPDTHPPAVTLTTPHRPSPSPSPIAQPIPPQPRPQCSHHPLPLAPLPLPPSPFSNLSASVHRRRSVAILIT
ncbi:hypothetical protein CALCODRAFT_308976 [Calocera cornea HHB12733]|uniref:Uncharacterized protein n=1 Tax=Calocera cornea HHB12733 TaxID=1353952 RepID=A0A165FH30_9BASI|nr:hypothetical protein CALCODRAFT_308976 [Calocera cornea HHB12733]